ncbi:MAG: putative bifunctional diguanylate cyclase/phosphodiesterase [Solirubrobacterales bacterium]
MEKRKIVIPLTMFCLYYLTYLCFNFSNNDALMDIIAPLGTLICFIVIFNRYLKSKGEKLRHFWLFIAMSSFAWAAGDIIWAVMELCFKLDPEKNTILTGIYILPNVLFFLAAAVFLCLHIKKWNMVQLSLDIAAISTSSFLLIWVLFFNRSSAMFYIITKDGFMSETSIILDFIIIAGIALWFLSVRAGKTSLFVILVFTGISIYCFNDLYYYYIYFNDAYIPNDIIDGIYILSFIFTGVGAVFGNKINYNESYTFERKPNEGVAHNAGILLLCPSLIIIIRGFDIYSLFASLAIIFIYEILSINTQNAIKKNLQLDKEKHLNIILEKKIEERTREIYKVNEELKEKNLELAFLSNQDSVTKLYNRRFFINAISSEIDKIKDDQLLAVLFVDMDRFKTINDSYGHHIGDHVLVELSNRFRSLQRENVIIARLGGDEFVFAVLGTHEFEEIVKFSEEIISCCNKEFIIDDYRFNVTLSIGASIFPIDAKDCTTLMKNADMAMYHAKSKGQNKCAFFNKVLMEKVGKTNEIEMMLRNADYDKEFTLFYQPQFSIPDKKLLGIEALLRWNSPQGLISPCEFIPIAEEMGHIVPIGEWVMKEAVRQIAIWNRKYSMQLKMGINISPKQLDNKNFINVLKEKMESEYVDSKWLDIELTERITIEDEYRIAEISDLFQGVGTSISIDDFGTGYSSLSYLKMFFFDRIKIAQPLIDSIGEDTYDKEIVKAIITLAKSIGIKTIAEGVETEQQLDILTELGCEEIQGFLLGKPMPAELFEKVFLNNIEKINTEGE